MTIRSKSFIQSIGVDQHIGWTGTPYANLAVAKSDLAYLGVTLVRDAAPASYDMADYQSLANAGIRFDLLTSPSGQDLANTLAPDIANIAALAQSNPGSVLSVEAPNELNGQIVYLNGASSSDPATGAAIARAVSQAVHNNATLTAQNVDVVNVSLTNGMGGWENYLAGLGNLSASVDYGNWHVYFNGGTQPLANLTSMYQYAAQSAPGKPVVFTETGYFTAYQDNSGWGGTDEATQAKNTLNLLADAYKLGVAQTYLYELMEGVANPSATDIENTFGLFRADGTPKPVATAIHNLTTVLADPAQNALTFTLGTLNYSISNLPSTGNSLLLEKASGVFDLMVWNEAPDWNLSTHSAISVAPTNAVVNLGATYSTVKIFDPLQGSTAIKTLNNVSSVTLGLTDHPMIIEVAAGTSQLPANPSPDGTQITSASASPIIDQAGNAWTLVQSASQGLQIAVNGTVDATTSSVILLKILGGNIVQENSAANWYSEPGPNGPWTQISPPVPPAPAVAVTTGSGSDTLVLTMSEDAYQGDAKFTVAVDGKQLAGTFTATAPHATSASQSFTFKGDWAVGAHTLAVNFLNDAYGGTTATDRNLYVSAVSYNGTTTGQSAALMSTGPKSFGATDATAIPSPATGSGADTLVLSVSEDAYLGNAQFTVAVDGKQLGGTFTATALHATGASQPFTFKGDFGAVQHAVAVKFLNDAYAGTAATDRNLYVNAVSYNGTNTNQSGALMSTGAKTFAVTGGTTPAVTETGDHGSLQKSLSQTGTYTVGGDTFVLSTGNAATVTLGTGTSQIKFIGPSAVTLTGGSGQAVVTADAGSNRFVAGTGSLDVTGGGGKDGYVFHANSGLLTLQDFSLAKGDTLTVDKALQGSLQQASDGQGGTMLTFGTAGHGVGVHGIATLPSANILWV
jgi:hypothetical protein